MIHSERRFIYLIIGLTMALGIVSIFSLSCGQLELPFSTVLASFVKAIGYSSSNLDIVTPAQESVLWYIRLPRLIVGLLVGGALAISGAVLQGIFSNPLVDPSIIGVSSGASVGAIIAISLGLASVRILILPACAFVGAFCAVTITVLLSWERNHLNTLRLLLSGVVTGMFLSAMTATILTVMNAHQMQQYIFWTIGGLDYRIWEHVLLGVGPITVGAFFMMLSARQLNVLALGEMEARAVGLSVNYWRITLLILASLTTATAVCISGNIGFVGLVVPHMIRLLTGADHCRLLPASFLAGAVFLVFCDTLGRIICPPTEIRVGIMTAFIGTPYFLYLLRRNRQKFF